MIISKDPQCRRWYPAALALIASTFAILCARGLAAPWHWGHNGYNGAAFSQAARNSLRFGVLGQAQYYFDLAGPSAADLYTHHPLALHAHLVSVFAMLGPHEWTARLIPFLYSVASWWLLVALVRRYWGRRTAVLTGLAYSLAPINLIFANMVDHEQGGIFACLLLLAAYLRWLETERRSFIWCCAAAVTFGAQWDWPVYYVAFVLAAHCAALSLRHRAPNGWRLFLGMFCTVTLANFASFLAWVYFARGGLDDMLGAFSARSQGTLGGSYLALIWRRLAELHGPLALGVAAIGAAAGVHATWNGGLQRRSLLPLAFAFAGFVHILAFPNAAELHAYWIYYWSPAIALASAGGLLALARALGTLVARVRPAEGARLPVVLLVALAFLSLQGPFALRAWHVQLNQGHAADCDECYFQRFERLWFTALAEHFGAAGDDEGNGTVAVRYALDASVHAPRIELFYYLDAPHRPCASPGDAREAEVLLVDALSLRPQDRDVVDELSNKHPTKIWMSRFYAIDLRQRGESVEQFRALLSRPTILEWWLTTFTDDAPAVWVPVVEPGSDQHG